MDVLAVTLDEVLAAAQSRAASLVPETSGYLALAIADCCERSPFRIDDEMVAVTTEGTVTVARGHGVVEPETSAELVRDMLARLLESSIGSMPALSSAAKIRVESQEGVSVLVRELEAALVPVNRAAARRALARLARETAKAKERGRLRPAKSRRVRRGPAPEARPAPEAPPVAQPVAVRPRPAEAIAPVEIAYDVDVAEVDAPVVEAPAPRAAAQPRAPIFAAREVTHDDAALEQIAEPTPTTLGVASEVDDALDPSAIDAAFAEAAEAEGTIIDPGASVELGGAAYLRGSINAPLVVDDEVQVRRSDVEDLLRGFVTTRYDSDASLRLTRSSLKRLAGVDPTPPPSAVAMFTQPKRDAEPRAVEAASDALPSIPKRGLRKARVALVAFGLVAAGVLGHYVPTWIERLGLAEAPPDAPGELGQR